MKKRLTALLVLCSVLLCGCDNSDDKPKFTGIQYVSSDEAGKLSPEETTTKSNSGGVVFYDTTDGKSYNPVTSIPGDVYDDYGELVETATSDTTVAATTTTREDLTPSDQTTPDIAYGDNANPDDVVPDPIDELNAMYATENQIDYYFTSKVFRGYVDPEGNMLSVTREYLKCSDKDYKTLIDEYIARFGTDYLTVHYGDHYETYWFTPDKVVSAMYDGAYTYSTTAEYNNDITEFEQSSTGVTDLKDGVYDESIIGQIMHTYGKPLHIDMFHVIWRFKKGVPYDVNGIEFLDIDGDGIDDHDHLEDFDFGNKCIIYSLQTGNLFVKETN